MSATLAVRVILRHPASDDVLLLRVGSNAGDNAGRWEFPGAVVDPGEDFGIAIQRAVHKQTGLEIRLDRPFETCAADRPGGQIVFLVFLATAKSTAITRTSEHDEACWTSPEKFSKYLFCTPFRTVARRYAQHVAALRPQAPPSPRKPLVTPDSLENFLTAFREALPRYQEFSTYLEETLKAEVKPRFPLAQVSARPKELKNFANKIIRKDKYKDPLRELTDLTGARIVLHLQSEVEIVGDWIRSYFLVDEKNSLDTLSRLGTDRFGYRSVHYVVEITEKRPLEMVDSLRARLIGLKAEIQVRTLVQHAWSDIGHDRLYKSECEVPEYWRREAARAAALLEAADEQFTRIVRGVANYAAHTPRCPDRGSARDAADLVAVIRRHVPEDAAVAMREVRLAIEIEDWLRIQQIVNGFEGAVPPPELRSCRALATFKLATTEDARRKAIEELRNIALESPRDAELELRLAGALVADRWESEALSHYRRAFALDPGNPAALEGCLRQQILNPAAPGTTLLPMLQPSIEVAIRRCRELVAAGTDLPRAYYRIAEFQLALGPDHQWEALATLARAVRETRFHEPDDLLTALSIIERMVLLDPSRLDVRCAYRLLIVALYAKSPGTPLPPGLAQPPSRRIDSSGPILIVAGGCDAISDADLARYRELLKVAFADFTGTILSGGTLEGIPGLVGDLAANSAGRIRVIGYHPSSLPTDGTAHLDKRYRQNGELRPTDGRDQFSGIEPIQNWLDILASDRPTSEIRLLGINGGPIAALEYRFALALGAQVGIFQGSGGAADRLLQDWPPEDTQHLLLIPRDPMTLRAFLDLGLRGPGRIAEEQATLAAQRTHQEFLDQQRYRHTDPVMQPWAWLRQDLQESNRSQIRYLERILGAAGFKLEPLSAGSAPPDPGFTELEIKKMAEMEHGRWNIERLSSGWQYAQIKSADEKLSPYIIPWMDLAQEIQQYDVENVLLWPETLAAIGLQIVRRSMSQSESEPVWSRNSNALETRRLSGNAELKTEP
jgi:ppGpp synthetase/RelA/SpoT-type nucleotidyltranferase/ADP-ribose pyrophosphatase YjhB (NUDIX family)